MHKHRFLFLALFIILAALVRLTPWALADMGLTDANLFERAFDKEVVNRAISGMGLTEAAQFAVVLWNASPLTALFLFGGARFTERRWAYIAPLAAIFLSDIGIGLLRRDMSQGLHAGIPAIYGSYMVIVWLGTQVRKIQDSVSGVRSGRAERAPLPRWQAVFITLAAAAGAGIAGEVVFFIVTNFATWVVQTGYYPHTAAGLMQCYAAGIPFFKYAVASTPIFAVALFGGSALVESWFPALKPNYVLAADPQQTVAA
ncbi:MAG TPA: DUF6580 family putative transport protein [Planctomycetaceae bacterium]|jgi:hypothetical protein